MNDMKGMGNNAIGTGGPTAIADSGHGAHVSSAGQSTSPGFSASYTAALSKMPNAQTANMAMTPGSASTSTAANATISFNLSSSFAAFISSRGPGKIPSPGGQHESGGHNHNVHENALALLAYRQQLLASNIANADTPNYKAVDIDVARALRNGQSNPSDIPLIHPVPSQNSADGNTVEMDS